jgi:hypothetical protein
MSQNRMDYLVADHQARLLREAAEQRLATIAHAARTRDAAPSDQPGAGVGRPRWSNHLVVLLHIVSRHQGSRLHPR